MAGGAPHSWATGVAGRTSNLEAVILVARLLSLGILLGLSCLAALAFSPWSGAQGAQAPSSGLSGQVERAPRRPALSSGFHRSSPPIWRPRAVAPPLHTAATPASRTPSGERMRRRQGAPMIAAERAGSRKAVPVARGQELGLRFRPDDNASPYSQPGFAPTDTGQPGSDALQSQFRPIPKRRKRTYEEMQSGMTSAPPQGLAPIMPYPMPGAPPLPGYGTYPPTW